MSLAAITSHFNFSGFNAPRRNLCRFTRMMKMYGVPLYGVELYLHQTEPFTAAWENWTQIKCTAESVMFQKEALLNLLVKRLPAEVKYVAWIDGDVMFLNRNWPRDTVEALGHFKAVQLFTHCQFSQRDGKTQFRWPGTGALGKMDLSKAHPGFAWAARRELWDVGGLYPYCISGAGDVIIAAALQNCGLPTSFVESLGVNNGGQQFLDWNTRINSWSRDSVGYISGDIYHEFHGSHKDRAYAERKDAMKSLDVAKHLKFRHDGVLQWTDAAPREIREYLKAMFEARREDV